MKSARAKSHSTKQPARRSRKAPTLGEAQAQKMISALKEARPAISDEMIDAIESSMRGDPFGPARRGALVCLRDTGAALIEKISGADHDGAVAIAMFYEQQLQYLALLRHQVELMENATTRVMMALCYRGDYDAVRREAQAQTAGTEEPGPPTT